MRLPRFTSLFLLLAALSPLLLWMGSAPPSEPSSVDAPDLLAVELQGEPSRDRDIFESMEPAPVNPALKAAGDAIQMRALGRAPSPTVYLEGIVVDSVTGEPVREAKVWISSSDGEFFESTVTGTSGTFRFRPPRLPRYTLRVTAEGFESLYWEGLSSGSRNRVEYRVPLETSRELRGVVTDEEGNPVGEADVIAVLQREGPLALRATRTDQQGRFFLEKLPGSGVYEVRSVKPGFYFDDAVEVRVPEEQEVVLVLESIPSDLLGVVFGRVTDPEGNPIAGTQVLATSARPGTRGRQSITTDAEGRYRFSGLSEGSYAVRTYPPRGNAPLGPAGTAWVEVRPGSDEELDLQLQPVHVVKGEVGDTQGRPVRRASVVFRYEQESGPGGIGIGVITQEDGSFEIARIPPGRHLVTVEHAEYVTSRIEFEAPRSEPLLIILEDGFTLRGVLNDNRGVPLEHFSLHFFQEDEKRPVRNTPFRTADGHFEVRGLSPGEYRLMVRLPSGRTYSETLTVSGSFELLLIVDPEDDSGSLRTLPFQGGVR